MNRSKKHVRDAHKVCSGESSKPFHTKMLRVWRNQKGSIWGPITRMLCSEITKKILVLLVTKKQRMNLKVKRKVLKSGLKKGMWGNMHVLLSFYLKGRRLDSIDHGKMWSSPSSWEGRLVTKFKRHDWISCGYVIGFSVW